MVGEVNRDGEMPPQEVTPKSPLAEGEVRVQMAKANDDTIDDAAENTATEFQGLTKQELMEYANDPFWKRLRVFFMILFWGGWLAMLALAVYVIIQAPRCEPKPTLSWIQESPMIQVDDISNYEAIGAFMTSLGFTSLYVPSVISRDDFQLLDAAYASNKDLVVTSTGLQELDIKTITDYVETPVDRFHDWFGAGYTDNQGYLNYSSEVVPKELEKVFQYWNDGHAISGFLVPKEEVNENPLLVNITRDINAALEEKEVAVGLNLLDMNDVVGRVNVPGVFKDFIMDNIDDWNYYQYNPLANGSDIEKMKLVTLVMMLMEGTPVFQLPSNFGDFKSSFGPMIRTTMEFRATDSIKFGETQFANTTENVIAFTRTRKGTPGYAVVVNLGDGEANSTEAVDFSHLSHVADSGTLAYSLDSQQPLGVKTSLKNVEVAENEGLVIQFVSEY